MKRSTGRSPPPRAHLLVAKRADEARHELSSRVPPGTVSESALAAACGELEDALSDRDGSPLPEGRAHIITGAWIESIAEMLERLRSDRERIAAWAGRPAADLSVVTGLDRSRSDPHRGGRRVAILEFRSGPRLVYKPRPVEAERAWERLVRWLGAVGRDPPLPGPRVLESSGYGWVEHVPRARLPGRRDRSGRGGGGTVDLTGRAGLLLSLLDVFEVRDAHAENVVACDRGPALVDPEAMAHPRFSAFEDAASLTLTGFVPAPPGITGGSPSSAGLSACLAPGPPVEETVGAVVTGYEVGHRILERHADRLLAPRGPLGALSALRTRVLLRPTATYTEALAVGGPLARAGARLAAGDLPVPDGAAADVLAAEREALARSDVPVFHVLAGGTDLLTAASGDGAPGPGPSRGGAAPTIGGVFETSGAERIRRRLERLDEADRRANAELLASILRVDAVRRDFGP